MGRINCVHSKLSWVFTLFPYRFRACRKNLCFVLFSGGQSGDPGTPVLSASGYLNGNLQGGGQHSKVSGFLSVGFHSC